MSERFCSSCISGVKVLVYCNVGLRYRSVVRLCRIIRGVCVRAYGFMVKVDDVKIFKLALFSTGVVCWVQLSELVSVVGLWSQCERQNYLINKKNYGNTTCGQQHAIKDSLMSLTLRAPEILCMHCHDQHYNGKRYGRMSTYTSVADECRSSPPPPPVPPPPAPLPAQKRGTGKHGRGKFSTCTSIWYCFAPIQTDLQAVNSVIVHSAQSLFQNT